MAFVLRDILEYLADQQAVSDPRVRVTTTDNSGVTYNPPGDDPQQWFVSWEITPNPTQTQIDNIVTLNPPELSATDPDDLELPDLLALIDGNTSAITSTQEDILTNASAISDIETDLSTVETVLADLATDVSALQTSQTAQDGQISGLSTSVGALQTSQNDQDVLISNLQTDVSDAEIAINTLDSDLTALETRVDTAETNVSSLQTSQTAQDGLIAGNSSAITGVDNRLTTAEGVINNLSLGVASLQSSVTQLFTDLANLVSTVTNLAIFVPQLPVTSFPTSPSDYQRVRRSDLGWTVWTWIPDAGVAGEWWGPRTWDGWGVSGNTNSGNYFRRWNGMLMSALLGIPLYRRYRILNVSGNWGANETGTVQVRVNGVSSGRNVTITNTNRVSFDTPTDNGTWVVGILGTATKQVLAGFWTGSSAMNAAQFRVEMVETRQPGE